MSSAQKLPQLKVGILGIQAVSNAVGLDEKLFFKGKEVSLMSLILVEVFIEVLADDFVLIKEI